MSHILSRRTVLRGTGLTVGLPLLEAMTPVAKSAFAAAPIKEPLAKRMAFIFVPNGVIVPDWNPEGMGKDYELSKTLSCLEDLKGDFNVISGLAQVHGRANGDGAGDHARSAASFLTGSQPLKSATNIRLGQSVDQFAAERRGQNTPLPSLEMGLESSRNAGSCDSGYSCAYSSNISWRSETTPAPKELNPRAVFERLFGTKGEADAQRDQRVTLQKSVLDVVAADTAKLQKKLGQSDRRKLDEYFTSLRDIETRLDRKMPTIDINDIGFDVPKDAPAKLSEYCHLMFDLLVLAFKTDTTRIATFMLANEGSNRVYPEVDVNDGHHQLSHHRDDKDKVASLSKIDHFLVSQFGYFLRKLKECPEGDSNLLDNSMIMYGSGISDGNRHRHEDLPVILAGRGGGSIDTGRHIVCPKETPMNNLFLSMLDRFGAPAPEFGDSTGLLKQLDA